MRCRRSRRFISDKLDGALRPRLGRALEAHLERCPDCRAHERTLRRLDSGASRAGRLDFTPEAGEEFLRRLERRLDRVTPRAEPAAASSRKRAWVWGSAGLAAAAGLLAWLVLPRPVPRPDIYALSDTEPFSGVVGQFSQSPGLEDSFNDLLLESIDDSLAAGEEYQANPLDNPLLWEGVSKEEIKQLEESISAESAR